MSMPLYRLAHARTGDKGNRSCISVIAYDAALWDALVAQVTEARVAALFAARRPTAVARYLLPGLHAMNFVIDEVLDGGVNGSLNLDTHGKCLSSLLLTLSITLDEGGGEARPSRLSDGRIDHDTPHPAQPTP